jgi:hypothetical protein
MSMSEPAKVVPIVEDKDPSEIFTIRMKKSLKNSIDKVAFNIGEKPAKTAQNYLLLSNIMTVRGDYSKTSINNYPLAIFPDNLMRELFKTMDGDINAGNRFIIQSDLGDKWAQYINDILSLKGIPPTELVTIFDLLKQMGWINYFIIDNKIAIPKTFGTRPFVYAFVYRLLKKVRFPEGDWNLQLFDNTPPHPGTSKKEEQKKNEDWVRDKYSRIIIEVLDPDYEKERNTNYYVFKKLNAK